MIKPKAFLKIASTNVAIFAILLLCAEVTYRLLDFAKSCMTQCDPSIFALHFKPNKKWNIGVSRFSPKLGYEPRSNIDLVLNAPGWKNIKLSTDANGFRNSYPNPNAKFKVLTVGDSFTWGDQVNDNDTWQSCLNRQLNEFEFINAGVFGYGTAQALMRSEEIMKGKNYDLVILQTLVGKDFIRDQFDIRDGFVRPYLKKSKGEIVVVPPPPANTPNTKYGPSKINLVDYFLLNLTFLRNPRFLTNKIYVKILDKNNGNINRRGIGSASVREIIDHTVKVSSKQNYPIVWLLQYTENLNENILEERKLIIKTLKKYDMSFIDTFETLHGNPKYKSDQLWNIHHTPLGNMITCQKISKDLIPIQKNPL